MEGFGIMEGFFGIFELWDYEGWGKFGGILSRKMLIFFLNLFKSYTYELPTLGNTLDGIWFHNLDMRMTNEFP